MSERFTSVRSVIFQNRYSEMTHREKSDIVAQKARETFNAIKELRKSSPQFTREQKDSLVAQIKQLQDQWWQDVKGHMEK